MAIKTLDRITKEIFPDMLSDDPLRFGQRWEDMIKYITQNIQEPYDAQFRPLYSSLTQLVQQLNSNVYLARLEDAFGGNVAYYNERISPRNMQLEIVRKFKPAIELYNATIAFASGASDCLADDLEALSGHLAGLAQHVEGLVPQIEEYVARHSPVQPHPSPAQQICTRLSKFIRSILSKVLYMRS